MTVYVDDMNMQATVPNGPKQVRAKWSHLMADTDKELIAFAKSIGLRAAWIQHMGTWKCHFDVTAPKRKAAIAAGAIEVKYGELHRPGMVPNTPWQRRRTT